MGINKSSPPFDVTETARSSLLSLSRSKHRQRIASLLEETALQEVTEPHRVYSLSLRSIIENKGLSKAREVGWRYFVRASAEVVAAIEIIHNRRTGLAEFSNFNVGNYISVQAAVYIRVLQDAAYDDKSYELRFLRIPGLDINSLLWLKDESQSESDLIVPLDLYPELNIGTAYSITTMEEALLARARSRMAFNSAP